MDDIKASVMSLKLGRTSPSIRKATSSQSLHSELGGRGEVRAPSPSPPTTVQSVPIAVAFQETCNAIFKGTDVSQCVVKVTGEMVVSLPSNYLGKLGSHSVLQFQLSGLHSVERLRHNQHLLVR